MMHGSSKHTVSVFRSDGSDHILHFWKILGVIRHTVKKSLAFIESFVLKLGISICSKAPFQVPILRTIYDQTYSVRPDRQMFSSRSRMT